MKRLLYSLAIVFGAGLPIALWFQNCGEFKGVNGVGNSSSSYSSAPVITGYSGDSNNGIIVTTLGQNLTLYVQAVNAQTYQWYRGGAAIVGATGSTFTKSNIVAADFTSYMVTVSNSRGVAMQGMTVQLGSGNNPTSTPSPTVTGAPTATPTPTPTQVPPSPGVPDVTSMVHSVSQLSRGRISGGYSVVITGSTLDAPGISSIRFPSPSGTGRICSITSQTNNRIACTVAAGAANATAYSEAPEFFATTVYTQKVNATNVREFTFAPVVTSVSASNGAPAAATLVTDTIGGTTPVDGSQVITLTIEGSGFSATASENIVELKPSSNGNPVRSTGCTVVSTQKLTCPFVAGLASDIYDIYLSTKSINSILASSTGDADVHLKMKVAGNASTPTVSVSSIEHKVSHKPSGLLSGDYSIIIKGAGLDSAKVTSVKFPSPSGTGRSCSSISAQSNSSLECVVAAINTSTATAYKEAPDFFAGANKINTSGVPQFSFAPMISQILGVGYPASSSNSSTIIGSTSPGDTGGEFSIRIDGAGFSTTPSDNIVFLKPVGGGNDRPTKGPCSVQNSQRLTCTFAAGMPGGTYEIFVTTKAIDSIIAAEPDASGAHIKMVVQNYATFISRVDVQAATVAWSAGSSYPLTMKAFNLMNAQVNPASCQWTTVNGRATLESGTISGASFKAVTAGAETIKATCDNAVGTLDVTISGGGNAPTATPTPSPSVAPLGFTTGFSYSCSGGSVMVDATEANPAATFKWNFNRQGATISDRDPGTKQATFILNVPATISLEVTVPGQTPRLSVAQRLFPGDCASGFYADTTETENTDRIPDPSFRIKCRSSNLLVDLTPFEKRTDTTFTWTFMKDGVHSDITQQNYSGSLPKGPIEIQLNTMMDSKNRKNRWFIDLRECMDRDAILDLYPGKCVSNNCSFVRAL